MTSQIPSGGVLLDRDGVLYPVEEDEHLVRATDGHLVCVRPSHAGKDCTLRLVA